MISFLRMSLNPSIVRADYLLIVTICCSPYTIDCRSVGVGLIIGDASAEIKPLGLLPVIQRVD